MEQRAKNKELMISAGSLALGLFMIYLSFFTLDIKTAFIRSAAIFPGIISIVFTILSAIYVINSFKQGGKLTLSTLSVREYLKNETNRGVLKAILLVAAFVFIGVPYISFYISGAILMIFVLLVYVKRVKPIYSIGASLATVAAIYLIFNKVFNLPIK